MEIDPNTIANVSAYFVIERFAIESRTRTDESEISVGNTEDKCAAAMVVKCEYVASNTRPAFRAVRNISLVVPELRFGTRSRCHSRRITVKQQLTDSRSVAVSNCLNKVFRVHVSLLFANNQRLSLTKRQ
jgi:hypothetical protein